MRVRRDWPSAALVETNLSLETAGYSQMRPADLGSSPSAGSTPRLCNGTRYPTTIYLRISAHRYVSPVYRALRTMYLATSVRSGKSPALTAELPAPRPDPVTLPWLHVPPAAGVSTEVRVVHRPVVPPRITAESGSDTKPRERSLVKPGTVTGRSMHSIGRTQEIKSVPGYQGPLPRRLATARWRSGPDRSGTASR
jgi:hypothetical protein